jgi:dihydrofolate synthase/folylpolyglutamate synthase
LNTAKKYFDYLFGLERSGMKYDLNNIKNLLKYLGNPHAGLNFIHIAGTNGKGAAASFIASILQEAKVKTGLYTSPHLFNFNERIRINGERIDNKYIFNFIDKHRKFIKKIKPSFFEVTTAIALNYFRESEVEIAVLEAGLGGRLDSTNIVSPKISVITQIAMDHMQYLGSTLNKIAKEKIGIVKKGIDVIVSDTNESLKPVFLKSINKNNLIYLKDISQIKNICDTSFELKLSLNNSKYNFRLTSPLLGKYQKINAACAVTAVLKYSDKCNLNIPDKAILNGVKNVKYNTGYFGRLEVIKSKGKTYIFDISHNPAGIKNAVNNLPVKPDIIVFGMMADKDYKSAIDELPAEIKNIIFTKPIYPRAQNPELMYEYSAKKFLKSNVCVVNDIKNAVMQAESLAVRNTVILYIGSFFLVSDAHKHLKKKGFID